MLKAIKNKMTIYKTNALRIKNKFHFRSGRRYVKKTIKIKMKEIILTFLTIFIVPHKERIKIYKKNSSGRWTPMRRP
jgi:hypothetical protein